MDIVLVGMGDASIIFVCSTSSFDVGCCFNLKQKGEIGMPNLAVANPLVGKIKLREFRIKVITGQRPLLVESDRFMKGFLAQLDGLPSTVA